MAKKSTTKASGSRKTTTKKKTTKASAGSATKRKARAGKASSSSGRSKKTTTKAAGKSAGGKKAPAKKAPRPKAAAPSKPAAVRAKPAVEEPTGPPTEAQLRKVKTDLTRKDLLAFRQLLLVKRAEILGDVDSLQNESRNGAGNLSHMPLHMADVGSDNYEQEFTLGLVESERRLLGEIDEALNRITGRTFGVCIESGTPIPRPRLEAKPWARYCIEVARERERRGLDT